MKLLGDAVCDHCLRANAPRLAPTGSLPRDDGLLCLDGWYTKVPFRYGGMHYVIGFTHHASGTKKSYRVNKKNDALDAIKRAVVWFNFYLGKRGLRVTWLHTDNAPELSKTNELRGYLDKEKLRMTTIAAGQPRANPQERSWRTQAAGMRTLLLQLEGHGARRTNREAYARLWGFAWDEYEAVLNLSPSTDAPHASPLMKLSGEKQSVAARRPFGCLAYVNDSEVGDKVTHGKTTAMRGIHLGYDHEQIFGPVQLRTSSRSYIVLVPGLAHPWVGVDCRFVADCFPGLRALKQGGTDNENESEDDEEYVPSPDEVNGTSNTTGKEADDIPFEPEIMNDWLSDAEWPAEKEEHRDEDEHDQDEVTSDIDATDPNPIEDGARIEVLYDLDGKYYGAEIVNHWRTKTTREWRHQVKWDGEWNQQTLNLNNEQWRREAKHVSGGVPVSEPPTETLPPLAETAQEVAETGQTRLRSALAR